MSEEKKFNQYKGYLFGEWKEKVLKHMEGLGYSGEYPPILRRTFLIFPTTGSWHGVGKEEDYNSMENFKELTPEQFLALTKDDVIEKDPPLRIAKYTPILGHDTYDGYKCEENWLLDFLDEYNPKTQEWPYVGIFYNHSEFIIFDQTNKEHIDLIGINRDYPGSIKNREVIICDGAEEKENRRKSIEKLFSIAGDAIEKAQELTAFHTPKYNPKLTDGGLAVPGEELVKSVEKAIEGGTIKITTSPIREETGEPDIPELAKIPDSEIISKLISDLSEEWLEQNLEVGDIVELKTMEEYEKVPENERMIIYEHMISYMGECGIIQGMGDYDIIIEFPDKMSFYYNLNIIKSVEKKSKQ